MTDICHIDDGRMSAARRIDTTRRIRRIALPVLLGAALAAWPAWGAELRGRITLADGKPAANEPILLNGAAVGRTDVAGVYWLNLPAGTHVLSVKGQEVSVQVSPNGSRVDIKLK